LKAFLKEADEDIVSMKEKYKEACDYFEQVANLLGEDPKKSSPEELFSILKKFINIIKVKLFT
jgi:DNA-directed RNA polymerase subunit F